MGWTPDLALVTAAIAAGLTVQPARERLTIVDADGCEVADADSVSNARFAVETMTGEGHGPLDVYDERGRIAGGWRDRGVFVWVESFTRRAA